LHAAKPRSPLIERGVAKPLPAAQLFDGHPGLGLFEKTDDLLIGESAFLHGPFLLLDRTLLTFNWYSLRGAGQGRTTASMTVCSVSSPHLLALRPSNKCQRCS